MKKGLQLSRLGLFAIGASLAACGGGGNGNGGASGGVNVVTDITTTQFNDMRGIGYASNGKIYTSGASNGGGDQQIVVARFNFDGTPDQSFGTGGFATVNLAVADSNASGNENSFAVVELADGDVMVVAHVEDGNGGALITAEDNAQVSAPRPDGQNVVLLRFNSDGTQDTSFGTNGVAEVVFGWPDAANGAWPVPSYNSISGFDGDGFAKDTAYDLQLDRSGGAERVVVFGYGPAPQASGRFDRDRYVARLNAASGAVDGAFNGGQAFSYNSPGDGTDNQRRGVVLPDGKILATGYTNFGGDDRHHVILIQLTADGTLDSGFTGIGDDIAPAQNGIAVFNPFQVDGGFAEAYAAQPQSDGSIVTTGYGRATLPGTPSTLGFVESDAQDLVSFRVGNGVLDSSWGVNGNQAIQSEGQGRSSTEERGRDMVVLNDDRSVHVGRFGGDAAIYVFTADGQLDTRVSDDGIIELPNATVTQQFFAAALSPDGQRIAVSTSSDDNGARLVVLEVD